MWVELAATVAADCHEREMAREPGVLPERTQAGIDDLAVATQERGRVAQYVLRIAQCRPLAREAFPLLDDPPLRLDPAARNRSHGAPMRRGGIAAFWVRLATASAPRSPFR